MTLFLIIITECHIAMKKECIIFKESSPNCM